jgi:methylglutaconyl-CoA hydratase
MSGSHIRIEGETAIRRIVLARPDVRNAFDATLIAQLTSALRALSDDPSIRLLILSAEGATFCAGADFRWMSSQKEAGVAANLDDAHKLFDLFYALYSFPCPVIARVQGGAFGGGAGLVACCDFVVMADDAVTAFSEVQIGLIPATISPFVMRRLGEGRSREIFLTGSQISAARALEIGLANRVVPVDQLDDAVAEYIKVLSRCSPSALRETKKLLREVPILPFSDLREFTARMIAGQRVSDEGQEGMAAFLEKRRPNWIQSPEN